MAQSLANILLHIVFSTKDRQPTIVAGAADELHRYLAGVCRELGCPAHQVGGTQDHVHMACSLARTVTLSKLVEDVKTSSSKWMKTKGSRSFAWQNGYGAFSFGQSQLDEVKRYIANQESHHRRRTFQEEFRLLLERYRVPYDDRYVWD